MAKTTNTYPVRVQNEARRMARDDKTPRQIAQHLGVPKRVVKGWIAPERDAKDCERAKRLAKRGHDPKGIAARLDADIKDVRRWLKSPNRRRPQHSAERRNSGRRHGTHTRRCAERMAEHQDPILHISEVLDITPKTTRTWLRVFESENEKSLLPGGRQRVHDRQAILNDVNATDKDGNRLYTRAQIREKYDVSRGFLSHLVNGKLDP